MAAIYYAGTYVKTLDDLTPRHREIALLVAEGYTRKAIGWRLFIEPQTVKGHLTSIYAALGIERDDERQPHVRLCRWVWEQQQ